MVGKISFVMPFLLPVRGIIHPYYHFLVTLNLTEIPVNETATPVAMGIETISGARYFVRRVYPRKIYLVYDYLVRVRNSKHIFGIMTLRFRILVKFS